MKKKKHKKSLCRHGKYKRDRNTSSLGSYVGYNQERRNSRKNVLSDEPTALFNVQEMAALALKNGQLGVYKNLKAEYRSRKRLLMEVDSYQDSPEPGLRLARRNQVVAKRVSLTLEQQMRAAGPRGFLPFLRADSKHNSLKRLSRKEYFKNQSREKEVKSSIKGPETTNLKPNQAESVDCLVVCDKKEKVDTNEIADDGTILQKYKYLSCKSDPVFDDNSPRSVYIRNCKESRTCPETCGITDRKKADIIDLSFYGLGNNKTLAAAESFQKIEVVRSIKLRDNRISGKGAGKLLKHIGSNVRFLDLSENKIGTGAVTSLLSSIKTHENLTILKLNSLGLPSSALLPVLRMVGKKSGSHLKSLHLADNNLGNDIAATLGNALRKSKSLMELNISWNGISGIEAAGFAEGLAENKSLKILDLRWNSFGQVASELSNCLARNGTLTHLDLSYNNISAAECEVISEGLNKNFTLFGLHMHGNSCTVDANGFLVLKNTDDDLNDSRILHTTALRTSICRVFTEVGNLKREKTPLEKNLHLHKLKYEKTIRCCPISSAKGSLIDLASRCNCWICGGWSPLYIEWTKQDSNLYGVQPKFVSVRLNSDGFKVDHTLTPFEDDNNHFHINVMVPPGICEYFFRIDKKNLIKLSGNVGKSSIESTKAFCNQKLDPPIYERDKESDCLYLNKTQIDERLGKMVMNKAYPRWLTGRKPKVRGSGWSFGQGCFATYKRETPKLLRSSFDVDVSYCKMNRVIKNESMIPDAVATLKTYYKEMRSMYIHFSAASKTVTSVAWNSFTDMCHKLHIVDEYCKLTEIDNMFVAVNQTTEPKSDAPKSQDGKKLNPDRDLCRYELIEIFARIAMHKYFQTGRPDEVETPAEAVVKLFEQNVKPNIAAIEDPTIFRTSELWTEEVDQVYKKYLPLLKKIFEICAGEQDIARAPSISLSEWISFCQQGGYISETFTDRNAKMVYRLSFMPVLDEMKGDDHLEMKFVEFLEALGRVANSNGSFLTDRGVHEQDELTVKLEKTFAMIASHPLIVGGGKETAKLLKKYSNRLSNVLSIKGSLEALVKST